MLDTPSKAIKWLLVFPISRYLLLPNQVELLNYMWCLYCIVWNIEVILFVENVFNVWLCCQVQIWIKQNMMFIVRWTTSGFYTTIKVLFILINSISHLNFWYSNLYILQWLKDLIYMYWERCAYVILRNWHWKKSSDFLYANTDFIQSGLRIAVFKVKFAWSLDNYWDMDYDIYPGLCVQCLD